MLQDKTGFRGLDNLLTVTQAVSNIAGTQTQAV